ncbi:MAG: CPBP family intramembrane glutamic endopeptidase [Candidatus Dormiibacterota bacterium]
MTVGLSASGLPGLRKLRYRPQPSSAPWLLLGAAAGIAAYGVTLVGAAAVGRVPQGRRWLASLGDCTQGVPRALAGLLVIPASIGEELFWRDSVLEGGQCPGNDVEMGRIVRTTMVYAAVQAASLQPLPSLGALLLGTVTGLIRVRSGSIWPAVAAHLVYAELCLVEPGLPVPDRDASKWSKSTT